MFCSFNDVFIKKISIQIVENQKEEEKSDEKGHQNSYKWLECLSSIKVNCPFS